MLKLLCSFPKAGFYWTKHMFHKLNRVKKRLQRIITVHSHHHCAKPTVKTLPNFQIYNLKSSIDSQMSNSDQQTRNTNPNFINQIPNILTANSYTQHIHN
ncbi:hypothetical protein HanXRQr2_Chr07g0309751 [Helianthus annuus]|uniref:Uncharacterized protein n=1 Tax=Helianthus annuus TaxID=4232 RepID=A0A251UCP0_HELAN|nr:hypothetical protein HanXRQr2_Chr07g0309751 [Helianthus annuus]